MAKNRIRLPSGMGGLTSYFEDYKSKLQISPGHVIVLCVLIIVFMIFLHLLGGTFIGG